MSGQMITKHGRVEDYETPLAPEATVPPAVHPGEPAIWSCVGNTPLIPVGVDADRGATVLLKAEWLNPGGSVKDRPAREILRDGLARGALTQRRLLDASSGNTAVAYALLGAAAGIGVTVCVPANASAQRKALLQLYGAEVILTDALEGTDGAIQRARVLAAEHPDRFWYADQYSSPANPRAHYLTTGPEIWRDTAGRVTHVVAGLGTSGTLMGAGRFLREQREDARVIGVQPDRPFHGLEGLKHVATAMVPPIYDPSALDGTLFVATEHAGAKVRALARTQGLGVGWSTGAALVAAEQVLLGMDSLERARAVVVVIAPDGASRYLDERRLVEA